MPEDRDEEQQEAYHKVDHRIGHRPEEAGTDPAEPRESAAPPADDPEEPVAPPADEDEVPEAALDIDMYSVLRMVFGMCVEQAWVHLGLQLAPGAKETKTDLPQARLAIDTIAYLKDALGDNLSEGEKREVEQILATLRMNYLQRT